MYPLRPFTDVLTPVLDFPSYECRTDNIDSRPVKPRMGYSHWTIRNSTLSLMNHSLAS